MNITKNSLLTFVTSASVFGIGFLVTILIGRKLGPEGQGVFSLMYVTAMYFIISGNLGLTNANIYFTGKKAEISEIAGNSIVFFIIITAVLLGIFTVISRYLLSEKEFLINFEYILIPLILFNILALSLYQARKLFVNYNLFVLLRPLSFLVLVLYLKLSGNFTIINTIYAFIGSFLIVNILQIVLSGSLGSKFPGFNGSLLVDSLKYGVKGQFGNFLQYFNYRLDFFFVNHYVGEKQLGYYAIATSFAEILFIIAQSISSVIFPAISGNESEEEIRKLTERSCRIAFTATLTGGVILYFAGRVLIPVLYAGKFNESIQPMTYLLPGVIILSIGNILAHNLMGRNFPLYPSIASGMGLVITIILDILLIPEYGIIGAAAASSIAYTTTTIAFVLFYSDKTNYRIIDLVLIKKEDLIIVLDKVKAFKNRNQ